MLCFGRDKKFKFRIRFLSSFFSGYFFLRFWGQRPKGENKGRKEEEKYFSHKLAKENLNA